ncbi:hypothetical protein BDK51DRAFT_25596 [Blyttiomyces helicus]|uniref:Uncharacterized protein n=1 Tax=Blyttiomyces helicus TaxID=388810 RepID=A0A4P9W034_9FUNG|nr:hypothetical protein BDK51DRAFT_25596 [Blyttiomyces helicus]|eukprot:RKO83900.1 hypothetical protein BDK51DRAFT_25596 [Blyttiomyces helicus]
MGLRIGANARLAPALATLRPAGLDDAVKWTLRNSQASDADEIADDEYSGPSARRPMTGPVALLTSLRAVSDAFAASAELHGASENEEDALEDRVGEATLVCVIAGCQRAEWDGAIRDGAGTGNLFERVEPVIKHIADGHVVPRRDEAALGCAS